MKNVKSVVLSDSRQSLKSEKTINSSIRKKKGLHSKNLLKKRNDLFVYYDKMNVTPKILQPVESDNRTEYISFSQLEILSNYEVSVFGNLSASILQSHLHSQSIAAHSHVSKGSIMLKDGSTESDMEEYSDNFEEDEDGYIVSEAMPTKIHITLSETSVVYILDLNSTTEVKGTDEGNLVEKDNENYEYLTVGKGRNRKTTNAEIQTMMCLQKSRATMAKKPSRAHGYAFASNWDMYDTFNEQQQIEVPIKKPVNIKGNY